MAMNYIEAPRGALKTQQEQYSSGIAQMASLARDLQSQGLLPERFAPEPSRLHPSLEGKIRIEHWTIGGKDGQTLLGELTGRGVRFSYAKSMVGNSDFTTLPEPQEIEVGKLKVGDLGIEKDFPTTADIIGTEIDVDEQGNSTPFTKGKMSELGLELLPAEALLHYLLEIGDKLQRDEPIIAGMKPVAGSIGSPRVFAAGRHDGDGGLWLRSDWADPGVGWSPDVQFAFGIRK